MNSESGAAKSFLTQLVHRTLERAVRSCVPGGPLPFEAPVAPAVEADDDGRGLHTHEARTPAPTRWRQGSTPSWRCRLDSPRPCPRALASRPWRRSLESLRSVIPPDLSRDLGRRPRRSKRRGSIRWTCAGRRQPFRRVWSRPGSLGTLMRTLIDLESQRCRQRCLARPNWVKPRPRRALTPQSLHSAGDRGLSGRSPRAARRRLPHQSIAPSSPPRVDAIPLIQPGAGDPNRTRR